MKKTKKALVVGEVDAETFASLIPRLAQVSDFIGGIGYCFSGAACFLLAPAAA